MLAAFLTGNGAAAGFALVLHFSGLLWDRGAAAMSLVVVVSLYPLFAIASGLFVFVIHLAILGGFIVLGICGYLFAPRLIALAVLGHALLDLCFILIVGETIPEWVFFDFGFDLLLGIVFLRTMGTQA